MEPELQRRVVRLIEDHVGVSASSNLLDEPIGLRAGSAGVYLRLLDGEPPVLRVFSPMLNDVDIVPDLLEELNQLNGQHIQVRLFARDRTVFAAAELVATTLDPEEVVAACDAVSSVADHYDDLLQARFGGTTTYPEP